MGAYCRICTEFNSITVRITISNSLSAISLILTIVAALKISDFSAFPLAYGLTGFPLSCQILT